ncbi:MAG: helix-turn-helix domain-containing protein [Candidatus Contendobacter sp.]|nr:helix-turn-helix domain-containing protein [Candidatus Contendobacter sp.]
MNTPIAQAVQRAGGQVALANALHSRHPNVKQQHVWKWLRAGRVPAEYVLAVEAATGISRHELRPDIYPVEDRSQAA